ncbi:DUF354 domain-containing protein [Geovibrio thiophilus]|uniref:DUF354 domain-containing protein n=1 Tax=Geovibrio thiophilus TaxID=139438 RepID=A0A410JVP1_9BACT|nr:DUF354 domain-containing protein [Geovibrio thiophilus]QAR32108.1 DUF354 domain-containing protein [Geovibrio thiophilus]
MIWFDLITPKSVLFFKPIIDSIKAKGRNVLITTRQGEGYSEIVDLLKLYKMDYVDRGVFGGERLADKLSASIERQKALMEYVSIYGASKLVCLCSVDANRVAFGLGIPIINFYDIPLSDHSANFKKALPQARLTLPLSEKVFKPFVVPDDIFVRFSLEPEQIYEYNFIDPLIWLKDFKADFGYVRTIFSKYGIDPEKPYIVVREEEYKSSYVSRKYPFLYEGIMEVKKITGANVIFIPRYESDHLKNEFPDAYVIEEKIIIQHLLAFAGLFIGGGGTLNTEACYFGTPTISTRSFISHYDKYQIDQGLMVWANNREELIRLSGELFGKRQDEKAAAVFTEMSVNLDYMTDIIIHGKHAPNHPINMFESPD